MITTAELQNIFPIRNGIDGSIVVMYQALKDHAKELMEIGHNLWLKPINYMADLVIILDKFSPFYNKEAIAEMVVFINQVPKFDANNLDASIKAFSDFFSQDIKTFIKSNPEHEKNVKLILESNQDFSKYIEYLANCLHFYIINLRHVLADRIIAEAANKRPQVMLTHSHPIYRLYNPNDITGGAIGDGRDLQTHKSLISSNDVSGLLIKLKSIYMKAAYLQLIQTLSQLAEHKAYKSITFRQDELQEVLSQVKKLSQDTFRQLKIEDELISKMCINIIKIIDPAAKESELKEALSLDLGSSPSYNFSVQNYQY